MGVGEGHDFSISALQVYSAVCGAHLLAAGARAHQGGGQLRVTRSESETQISQSAINADAALGGLLEMGGLVEETESDLTLCKYCRLLHSMVCQSPGWTGTACVSPSLI